MVTVALIGADGAGKTTVARRLEEEGTLRIKYLYMGVNPEATNHMLVTTRLLLKGKRWLGKDRPAGGPPDPSLRKPPPSGIVRRALYGLKSGLRLANQLAEEWSRQLLAWRYQRRGHVVLFDRHFYADYHAHDISGASGPRSLARKVHGFLLSRLYPKPDLVILLDAPSEVLFERKCEGTLELVERRRQEYIRLRDQLPEMAIVNVNRPLDLVTREVLQLIREHLLNARKEGTP